MVSKSSAVKSIRLQNDLWATIKADADARGEPVNAVIARHLRIAYAPKDKLTVEHIADVTLASPLGARAMRQVNARTVVPTYERKAFNPQPKTGKGKK